LAVRHLDVDVVAFALTHNSASFNEYSNGIFAAYASHYAQSKSTSTAQN